MSEKEGELQDYSVDQLAGAVVLILGAVGSLLLVIWQSRCHCKMNLCYIFQCERRPPSEDEMKGLKAKAEELKGKDLKTWKQPTDKPDETLIPPKTPTASPRINNQSSTQSPEPEPEPESISSSWRQL